MNEVTLIQATWRSVRCRKKVTFFSQLPSDIWLIILDHIRKNTLFMVIDKIIKLRVIRLYWGPPRSQIKKKMQSVTLVRKYLNCLSPRTLLEALRFLYRLLRHSYLDICTNLMINACLEDITKKIESLKHHQSLLKNEVFFA